MGGCTICGGAGCAICKHSGWVEIMGCGMVDPAVLTNCGIDPEVYSESIDGLRWQLEQMLKALDTPVLTDKEMGI